VFEGVYSILTEALQFEALALQGGNVITTAMGRRKRVLPALAIVGAAAVLLTACSTGGSGATTAKGSAKFQYVGADTNTEISSVLKVASTSVCKSENKAQPLTTSTTPGTTVDQHLQLLAGQNALPTMVTASGTPALMKQFIKAKKIVDVTKALGSAASNILPAAQSTIQNLYGTSDSYVFPTEFNVEGIWYNKKIFTANNITVPTTWNQLVTDTQTLEAAGVQPISTDGKDGWPITRLVGDYLYRDLGPDAMSNVASGKTKLTDPDYVKAATAVQTIGKQGAFGKSPSSIDYNTMESIFLSGKAAMMYNGSWTIANFTDPKQDTVGLANIGFMPFPAVSGGKGSIDQYPSNIGIPVMFSTTGYGTKTQAWMKCIAENYGNLALANGGVVSGFKATKVPSNLPALTAEVQKKVAASTSSVLWFEALFGPKQTTVSQQNAAGLATGAMTPAAFMQLVQAAQGS